MVRIPDSIVLGLVLLLIGAGLLGFGWHEDTAKDCPGGVGVDRVEQPSSADVTNFSALTTDQQGVFLLAFDDDDGGYISTADDEIMDVAYSLPSEINYEGTTYEVRQSSSLCAHGLLPKLAGAITILLSVLVFAIRGIVAVVRRARD